MSIDTFYLSNISEYIVRRDRVKSFQNALKHVISPKTLLIDTCMRPGGIFSPIPLIHRVGCLSMLSVEEYFPDTVKGRRRSSSSIL